MERISIYREALILRILDLDILFRKIARWYSEGKFKRFTDDRSCYRAYQLVEYLDYFDNEDKANSAHFIKELFGTPEKELELLEKDYRETLEQEGTGDGSIENLNDIINSLKKEKQINNRWIESGLWDTVKEWFGYNIANEKAINYLTSMKEGYLKGYQNWKNGETFNNISAFIGEDKKYYKSIREINIKQGTVLNIGAVEISEDEYNEIRKDARKDSTGTPRPDTWCNFAANVFAIFHEAASLTYSTKLNEEFNTNKLYDYLKDGYINNSSGKYVEIGGDNAWEKAAAYAENGDFVIAIIPGHVATLLGGYVDDNNRSMGNVKIFQAGGAGSTPSGNYEHRFGKMRLVESFFIKKPKFYRWVKTN